MCVQMFVFSCALVCVCGYVVCWCVMCILCRCVFVRSVCVCVCVQLGHVPYDTAFTQAKCIV